MNPFFFGVSERQLYGIHHPPEGTDRDAAVLLCPPLGHEYIASHRSLYQLAGKLARLGCHAMRFDFFGCGDSAGDLTDATVKQWLDDVGVALQELRDTSGARRMVLVGLRLGGALAATAAQRLRDQGNSDLHGLVLWETVVRGSEYLAGLERVQQAWLRGGFPRPKPAIVNALGPEVLGFPLTLALQSELGAIDLTQLPDRPADRILIMQNDAGDQFEALRQRYVALGAQVDLQHLPARQAWLGEHRATIVVPPAEVTQAIAAWIGASLS